MAARSPKTKSRATKITTRVSQSSLAAPAFELLTSAGTRLPHFIPPAGIEITDTKAAVPDKFVEATAVMIDQNPELEAATNISTGKVREAIAFIAAVTPFANQAIALGTESRVRIGVARGFIADQTKAAYEWLQWKAKRKPVDKKLVKQVAQLKKLLGKGRPPKRGAKKAAAKKAGAPPTPATPPTKA